ncbi:hypothetical protein [Salinarchaeum laminariae]|uniref:hypothetical protein n=1 Tax=Salinarchaeum laminariae TaxID=869888 RepID=UPI0020BD6651|nr:hypothetical protein [Salinarchaeum laminariae]
MRILDATINWREHVANDPRLQVLVDEIPSRDELRYEHEDGIWCAIADGYVSYFAWSSDGNDGGFSGQSFDITTVDGDAITLRGPWSARAGVVNQRSFGPVVDVQITTDQETIERGGTFSSGSLSLCAAKQAVDRTGEDCHLERHLRFSGDEPYWLPVRNGGTP